LIPIKAGTAVDIFQALDHFKSSTSETLFGSELKTVEDISRTGPIAQTSRCSAQAASELWIRMQMAQSEKQIRELYRFVQ
jgi:hypothetical protein